MTTSSTVTTHIPSLFDLLLAQCEDLEALLALARREEQAAAQRDFDEVLRVVTERATLGERLEVYHRQIAELRAKLGASADHSHHHEATKQTALLVTEIQAADARTRPLLLAACRELTTQRQSLEHSQRGVKAYLREGRLALAYDQRL